MDLVMVGKLVIVNIIMAVLGHMAVVFPNTGMILIGGIIVYAIAIENTIDKASRRSR